MLLFSFSFNKMNLVYILEKKLSHNSQLSQFSFTIKKQKNSLVHSVALKFSSLPVMLFSPSVQNDGIVVLL